MEGKNVYINSKEMDFLYTLFAFYSTEQHDRDSDEYKAYKSLETKLDFYGLKKMELGV